VVYCILWFIFRIEVKSYPRDSCLLPAIAKCGEQLIEYENLRKFED
jgi:hypothetical protein